MRQRGALITTDGKLGDGEITVGREVERQLDPSLPSLLNAAGDTRILHRRCAPDRHSIGSRHRTPVSRSVGAQFEQSEQQFVALGLQLCNGAGSDFGFDARDQLPLHLRRQDRRAEAFP